MLPLRGGRYFFVVTLSTVGYGDIAVSSEPAMVFMVFYSFCGLLLAAAIIGILSVQSMHRREKQRAEADAQLDDHHLFLFVDDEDAPLADSEKNETNAGLRTNVRRWFAQQHTVLRVLWSSAQAHLVSYS